MDACRLVLMLLSMILCFVAVVVHSQTTTSRLRFFTTSHFSSPQQCIQAIEQEGTDLAQAIARHVEYFPLEECLSYQHQQEGPFGAKSQYNQCSGNTIQQLVYNNVNCEGNPLGTKELHTTASVHYKDECNSHATAHICNAQINRDPFGSLFEGHLHVRISYFAADDCNTQSSFEYLPTNHCHFVSRHTGYIKVQCEPSHLIYSYYLDSNCETAAQLNHTLPLEECLHTDFSASPFKVECNSSVRLTLPGRWPSILIVTLLAVILHGI
mmetsp:Transcript_2386/g.8970  ORF Transcript_2386/g.8970 Transcript_2386/m.8970 type:complete len:268 (+) Transcript_2386:7276-8079(+)